MAERVSVSIAATGSGISQSAFAESGMAESVDGLIKQIQGIYLSDGIPWVVGYSGGKDSTAALQLIWMALKTLSPEVRSKPVYVITNDTLVENPVVSAWVNSSLQSIAEAARLQELPIETHRLTPEVGNTFWVNLIGRGYPAPSRRFRWCTARMKIDPSTRFIREVVRSDGEAIVVLGARSAESAGRAARIAKYDAASVREHLSPHNDLASALIYKPIVDWTNDDVWTFLMQYRNPWGFDNKSLMTLYRSATQDAECPVVIDTSTVSCGSSRFGCWTCTVVDKDKSMAAMIQNDSEKDWMQPLLDIRDELSDAEEGKKLRDFRRMKGSVFLYNGDYVPGPYTQAGREHWLRRVLEAQTWVRKNGPLEVRNVELISLGELNEIRKIWVLEKHEYEDLLPRIYEECTGEPFLGDEFDEHFPFGAEEMEILNSESTSQLQYELLRELIGLESRYRSHVRRNGVWDDFSKAFERSGYQNSDEAIFRAKALSIGRESVFSPAHGTFDEIVGILESNQVIEATD